MRRKSAAAGVSVPLSVGVLLLAASAVTEAAVDPDAKVALDTMWVLAAGFLVFWMNAGFAFLASGLCQAKNAVNVLAKNVVGFSAAAAAFWVVGFGLMFGNGTAYLGFGGLGVGGADNSPAVGDAYRGAFAALSWAAVPLFAKFFFEAVRASTTATIVSGAVAERVKFGAFVVFSFLLVGVIYPVGGHWVWGGGWLAKAGFIDFAGSTVVHSVGGWAALGGAIVLGPRLGKYLPNGRVRPFPAHNMTAATLGTLIAWFGCFGFNAGSAMAVTPDLLARIVVNTSMAAVAGCLSSTFAAWLLLGKPDLSVILNGPLAGLVAVAASCHLVGVGSATIIGALAGVLAIWGVLFFDKIKLDDPVGVLSVYLLNGVFGTLAVGLFAPSTGLVFGGGFGTLATQFMGAVSVGALTLGASVAAWVLLRASIGIRVPREEEADGLDVGEHGIEAYAGFVLARHDSGERF
jgi:ammonium transporter, Amt family